MVGRDFPNTGIPLDFDYRKVDVWTTQVNKLDDRPVIDLLYRFYSRLIGRLSIDYR